MKVTCVKNGSLTLILVPEDDMDKAALAKLNGCILHKASDTMRVMNQPLADTMLIQELMKVPLDAVGNPIPPASDSKLTP